jgi:hypothetical protein
MELDSECLGIAVDSQMEPKDVVALVQLLSVFRDYVEKLYIDSPVIELLVSQASHNLINIFRVNFLAQSSTNSSAIRVVENWQKNISIVPKK